MLIRMFSASTAFAIALLFAAVVPARALPAATNADGPLLAQSTVNSSGSNSLPHPNHPGATSNPDVLIYPRDQRDAPPPAGLEVSPQSSRSSGLTSFQEARLLDPNLPNITSTPALLRLPRDQRDAPPRGLQSQLRRELYGQSQIPGTSAGVTPGNRVSIQLDPTTPITPSRSLEEVQRDPLGLNLGPAGEQLNSPTGTSLNPSIPDPNSPGATSDPALLSAPRDQRDAPPTTTIPSTNP